MKRGFGSDNHSGVSEEILEAIKKVNVEHALAYGNDEYTSKVESIFNDYFGSVEAVAFVFNGTGANVLNIDLACRSHQAVICADTAHINVDECGAPQRIVGCRLLTVKADNGKLTPDLVKQHLHGFGFEHHSQPRLISISQPTELGTLYSLDEVRALAELAHANNMLLHVDGSRLANAAVALGCSFKSLTSDCGVDCLSFGGTKNGMLMGESVVLFNRELAEGLKYRRKQMGQLFSKMRFVAAQFEEYLCSGLWKRNAEHSNTMAQLLYRKVRAIEGVKVVYPVQANSVFAQLPRKVWQALQKDYFFYDWDEAADVVRWMCSFDTTEADIDDFVAALKRRMLEQ